MKMKYEKLIAYVNNKDWENAVRELASLEVTKIDDVLAVYATAICFHFEQMEHAYTYIREGLKFNHKNYELYFRLGNYYESINPYQAWLCYENAEFYCDRAEDSRLIAGYRTALESKGIKPARTSIVILSYNVKDICMRCIESIRRNNPKSAYEIVVVDNASTDGIREWLKDQEDINLICNEENVGFPMGCNQGIEASQAENDIFLLNNDTMLFPNSLFWLRMALYEDEKTGATGSVTNFAGNGQMVRRDFSSLDEVMEYGISVNIPEKNALENKIWLVGYALLLKRKALDEIGLLDTRFSPGSYEDNDIGVRLRYAGWKVYLCHNSFIFHYGSGAGQNRGMWDEIEKNNEKKFREKWGFNIRYYTNARGDLISLIKRDRNDPIHVLEVGCGGGATLNRIKYLFPNAQVRGIELVEDVAELGINQVDIIQGNIETMQLPYEKQYFDYIIFGDVLEHLYDPEAVLQKLKPYLRVGGGQFLCSIPNVMHVSVILSLLQGEFRYEDAGILDRTHIRFFTWRSICAMLNRCGLEPTDLSTSVVKVKTTKENEELLQAIYSLPRIAPKEQFQVYQYVLSAGIADDEEVTGVTEEDKTPMKKVSVVVPCYNVSMHLYKCVDHLLSQTIGLENLEIILVDNASTDEGQTWKVITDYEKQYPDTIIAVQLEEHMCQGGARNVGLSYASGEFLIFCDAEDWLLEEALERLYSAASEYNADVVECLFKYVFDHDAEVKNIETGDESDKLLDLTKDNNRNRFLTETTAHKTLEMQRKLYRMSFIKENNIQFVEQWSFGELSFEILARLYARKWYFFNQRLYVHCMPSSGRTEGGRPDHKMDAAQAWLQLLKDLKARGVLEQYFEEIEYLFMSWHMFIMLKMWIKEGYTIEISELKKLQDTVIELFPMVMQNRYLINKSENDTWRECAINVFNMEICDESVTFLNELLSNMVNEAEDDIDFKEIETYIDTLLAAHRYEEIKPFLESYMNIVKNDINLAIVYYLCDIYEQEKAEGMDPVFSKVNTLDELLERYTGLKFLLRRLDFGVSDCGADDLNLFMQNFQVSPVELAKMMDYSVVHKDRVWKEIEKV